MIIKNKIKCNSVKNIFLKENKTREIQARKKQWDCKYVSGLGHNNYNKM